MPERGARDPLALPTPRVLPLRSLGGNAYQSVNSESRRCLVFLVERAGGLPIQYQGLLLEYLPRCEASVEGHALASSAVVVHCREMVHEQRFDAIIHDVRTEVAAAPFRFANQDRVTDFVQDYAGLFAPLPHLPDREQRGLWGELYMITQAHSPEVAVEAWHGPEQGLIDFAGNSLEVEIKTSAVGHRHRVKHEQVSRPTLPAIHRYLWSIKVEESARGKTLGDLVRDIREGLSIRREFESKLHRAGYADNPAYDGRYKVASERVVDHSAIPALPPMPAEISHLEYDLDVDRIRDLDLRQGREVWKRLTGG